MTADRASLVEQLKTLVREYAPGGCRILSLGDECECPLCAIDQLAALWDRPAGDGQGWQPIDTAPKDLTEVLVFDPDYGGVRLAQYEVHAQQPFWSIDVWDLTTIGTSRDRIEIFPTHWMPLPDPPVPSPDPAPAKETT